VSLLAICLIGFYYVDSDRRRINEGNTLRDFLFLSDGIDNKERFLVYTPFLNVFILAIFIVFIVVDELRNIQSSNTMRKITLKVSGVISRLLSIKLR
jgi:hypothetical protein